MPRWTPRWYAAAISLDRADPSIDAGCAESVSHLDSASLSSETAQISSESHLR